MKGRLAPLPILALALALPLAHLVPPLQGRWAQAPPDKVFLGFRYMAGDHYQYAGFIREARDTGALLMTNPFTSQPQAGVFLLPFFWLVGVTSRLIGASIPATWDLFRFAGALLYVLVFWRFTRTYFRARGERVAASLLFTFGGGLDWIISIVRMMGSAGAGKMEAPYLYFWNWSTFGTAVMPNWVWPAMLLMIACRWHLKPGRAGLWAPAALLPLVWFGHAYTGMVAYLMFGLIPVVPVAANLVRFEKPDWRRAAGNLRRALPGLASFGVVAAYLLWARGDEVFRLASQAGFSWTTNSRFSPWLYPLGYGLLLPLALYGVVLSARGGKTKDDLLLAWAAAAFLLSVNTVYAGVKFQYLLFPPLVTLAARGLFALRSARKGLGRLARHQAIAAAAMPLVFIGAPLSLVRDLPRPGIDRVAFDRGSEIRAMTWLATRPPGATLSSYVSGNMLPWLAAKPVYAGHWFLTPDAGRRAQEAMAFFSPAVPREFKEGLLERGRIRYVYMGARESVGVIDPGLNLVKIYDQEGVTIWEVPDRD